MFFEYQVDTIPESNYIINEFSYRLKWLEQKGIVLFVDNFAHNQINQVYKIQLQGENTSDIFCEEDIIYICKHQISEILADHIINDWEERLLWKEIIRTCKGNTNEEKQLVLTKALEFLKGCHDNESLDLFMKFSRKNKVAQRILEHLNDSNIIVIEGFINFCLPDYLREIRMAVDLAFEELKNEQEYNEFVKLLSYFVDTQIPKNNEVNLLMGNKGIFYLWDENGDAIEDRYMNYYLDDMLLNDINLDDVLISILITIAPRRIILHNITEIIENDAVEVICQVFRDKIKICAACERCCQHSLENEKRSKN